MLLSDDEESKEEIDKVKSILPKRKVSSKKKIPIAGISQKSNELEMSRTPHFKDSREESKKFVAVEMMIDFSLGERSIGNERSFK